MRGDGGPQSPHSSGAAVTSSYENPKIRWTHQGTHLYWLSSVPKVVSSTDFFSAPECTDLTPDPEKTKSQHFKGQQELNCILLMGKFCGIWKIRLQGESQWSLHLFTHSFKTIIPLTDSFKQLGYLTFFVAVIYSQLLSHRWLRGPYNSCSPNSGHLAPTEQILSIGKDSSEYQLNFYF